MSNDGLATYEAWDLAAPVVPPRSQLFHLNSGRVRNPAGRMPDKLFLPRCPSPLCFSRGSSPSRGDEVRRAPSKHV